MRERDGDRETETERETEGQRQKEKESGAEGWGEVELWKTSGRRSLDSKRAQHRSSPTLETGTKSI